MTITRSRELVLDAEQEVDVGSHARAVATRWCLPLIGLIAGALVGYLLSLSGTQVWTASSIVYLGSPDNSGGAQPVSHKSNPPSVARSSSRKRRSTTLQRSRA